VSRIVLEKADFIRLLGGFVLLEGATQNHFWPAANKESQAGGRWQQAKKPLSPGERRPNGRKFRKGIHLPLGERRSDRRRKTQSNPLHICA